MQIHENVVRNWYLLKYVLRGIFDTDGSLYFTKNDWKKYRRYPIIELSMHNDVLLKQVKGILDAVGFNTKIVHYKDSVKLHGKKNLLRWFKLIGSSHPDKHSKLSFWTRFGYCQRIDELNYAERTKILRARSSVWLDSVIASH